MATSVYAEHLTFEQQVDAGHADAEPCACWYAGRGEIRGIRKEECQHPHEFGKGWLAAWEYENDI